MLASLLPPPPFIDTYSQSTSSPGCKVPCIVISFLVLLSICLNSSLVHYKNGTGYFTWVTAQVFIPLIRFLLYSFISGSFLVLLRYSFFYFSFISTCFIVSAFNIHKYLYVSFFSGILIFLDFLLSGIVFRFCMAHFSLPNSISMSWLYSHSLY